MCNWLLVSVVASHYIFKWGANMINCQELKEVIGHRYPFLLVDKILEVVAGKKAVGIKNVTTNENFFNGHFPPLSSDARGINCRGISTS